MRSLFRQYRVLRVYAIFTAILIVWMLYANYTGCRVFSTNNRSWSADGPGGHK